MATSDTRVYTGIELLKKEEFNKDFKGNIALLCHSASIDSDYKHSLQIFKDIFKERLIKIFGPQHGLVTDVQDNMIETDHFIHPYFKLPVYSLYSETRIPTDEMLEGIDHLFIDLQDVGTRIYTYIYTMTYILEKCADKEIEIIILDRPNPIGGEKIEGNILNTNFKSFVGRHELPVRHALTIGEVARMHQQFFAKKKCKLRILKMINWKRSMHFSETGLPWVPPSPNLPFDISCLPFVGTVLFEGTNISEGRGTTRSLEIFGHPKLMPFELENEINYYLNKNKQAGYKLRPLNFMPTFQKHAGLACGGYHIHVLDREKFTPWALCQLLLKFLKEHLGESFSYKSDPYEYGEDMHPMDMINGDDYLRHSFYTDTTKDYRDLLDYEKSGHEDYLEKRESILLY